MEVLEVIVVTAKIVVPVLLGAWLWTLCGLNTVAAAVDVVVAGLCW